MNNKKRQSGIELMRIIAIYMIMLTHATYLTFGFPTLEEVRTDPVKMFGYIGMENVTIICVNIFVLISGWFSIKPRIKNVGGLIFQSLFFGLIVQLFFYTQGISRCSWKTIDTVITFLPFVNSYVVLCLIAPLLNSYCEMGIHDGVAAQQRHGILFGKNGPMFHRALSSRQIYQTSCGNSSKVR